MNQSRQISRLPFSVEAAPGESIPSLLHRLGAASGYAVREIFPHDLVGLYDGLDIRRVEAAALLLGREPDDLVAHHTLRGQHRPGEARFARADVRNPEGLRCPGCGVTPVWARFVLVTACPRCKLILTETSEKNLAPPDAIDLQDRYVSHQLAPRTSGVGDRLKRMSSLIRLYACLGLDPSEESLYGPGGIQVRANRAVSTNHWKSPLWVAGVAADAWQQTDCELLTEAHAMQVALTRAGAVGTSPRDLRKRLEAAEQTRNALHAQIIETGLTTANVPDYLVGGPNSLEAGCHTQMTGAAIADALRLEILLARGRRGQWKRMDNRCYGRRDAWFGEAMVSALRTTPPGLGLLARTIDGLVKAGTHDYEMRQEALRGLRTVPRSTLLRASLPLGEPTGEMAAIWIWVELTHGTIPTIARRPRRRATLEAFARNLRSEARLTLLEYGQAHLDVVETDVQLAQRRTQHATAGPREAGRANAV